MMAAMPLVLMMGLALPGEADASVLYVNNKTGADTNDGTSEQSAVATIARAVALREVGSRIVLADTGVPYTESIRISRRGGTPARPLVIEGGGATITGLAPIKPEQWEAVGDGVYRFPIAMNTPGRLWITRAGKRLVRGKGPKALEPEQFAWARRKALYFRCAPGKDIADYKLSFTQRMSGLAVAQASYIVCRNLVAEYFANDGFNVHGDCRGIVLENVVARFNGDDGISIHEAVGMVVRHAHVHDNTYGIQDVNASRSMYNGVLMERNSRVGGSFHGGFHSLVDCVARDNGTDQVDVAYGASKHMVGWESNPMCRSLVFLQNCRLVGRDARAGVRVRGKSAAAIQNTSIAGCQVGVVVHKEGVCHLTQCAVRDCKVSLVAETDQVFRDYNLYDPGVLSWLGREYGPEQWDAFRKAAGHDAHSAVGASAEAVERPVGPTQPVAVFGDVLTREAGPAAK